MADAKRLQHTLRELFDGQPDDRRLRDHLEGLVRDEHFPGLTWFWGPILYERNRAMFRGLVLNHFSDWAQSGRAWKHVKWSDHDESLQKWLDSARTNRDINLVRLLLRWKYAAKRWGIDAAAWNAALLRDYACAKTAAARSIALDEYDDWFEMDEETALVLYERDKASSAFILKHLPRTFWGSDKRKLWERLSKAAFEANDEELRFALYRKQIPIKQWRTDILALAQEIQDPAPLHAELDRRHPQGFGLNLGAGLIALLEARGRDLMPYVRDKLREILGGWHDEAKPFIKLASRNGWWDLWAAAIRVSNTDKHFNRAVAALLDDVAIGEDQRLSRLNALAGAAREYNWPGIGLAQVHGLKDEIAARLYARYPALIHGAYKPNVTPTWWQGYPKLLDAAQQTDDEALVDLLASRYATQIRYEHAYYGGGKERDRIMETADALGDDYQVLRDRDPERFARRAANVLTRIPAFSIFSYRQLLKTNKLARLLFVRSFDVYLTVPAAVRDLVEASDIHVQMLSYRILAQDDNRARQLAAETLDILIGTLLRPLHRKTRLAAFGALLSAARADEEAASLVLSRAREALRLPDKRYPKEQLIGLIGQILHLRPGLRTEAEQPVVYGLEEALA